MPARRPFDIEEVLLAHYFNIFEDMLLTIGVVGQSADDIRWRPRLFLMRTPAHFTLDSIRHYTRQIYRALSPIFSRAMLSRRSSYRACHIELITTSYISTHTLTLSITGRLEQD